MSSLLQHAGGLSADGRRVRLFAYLVVRGPEWERYNGPQAYNPSPDSTTFTEYAETLPSGNPALYVFERKPVGMFGCWVVFRYNGRDQVPDLSVPIGLFRLPEDAVRLSDSDAEAYWKS